MIHAVNDADISEPSEDGKSPHNTLQGKQDYFHTVRYMTINLLLNVNFLFDGEACGEYKIT